MATWTITLKEEQLQQLPKVAAVLGLSVEDIVQNSLDKYLTRRTLSTSSRLRAGHKRGVVPAVGAVIDMQLDEVLDLHSRVLA